MTKNLRYRADLEFDDMAGDPPGTPAPGWYWHCPESWGLPGGIPIGPFDTRLDAERDRARQRIPKWRWAQWHKEQKRSA